MREKRLIDVSMESVTTLISEILKNGGSAELTVSGNSMRPLLKHRISRVRLSEAGELHPGDIVLHRRDNGVYVLHRIVKISDGRYYIRGDNQYVTESGVRRDQMLAVVTAFSRDGKRWHSCDAWLYVLYRTVWVRSCFWRRRLLGVLHRIFSVKKG